MKYLKVHLTLLLILFTSLLFSQSIYYVNIKGEIFNESDYNKIKNERLIKIKKANKSLCLYEDLTQEYKTPENPFLKSFIYQK